MNQDDWNHETACDYFNAEEQKELREAFEAKRKARWDSLREQRETAAKEAQTLLTENLEGVTDPELRAEIIEAHQEIAELNGIVAAETMNALIDEEERKEALGMDWRHEFRV